MATGLPQCGRVPSGSSSPALLLAHLRPWQPTSRTPDSCRVVLAHDTPLVGSGVENAPLVRGKACYRFVHSKWALTEQPVGPVCGSKRTAKSLNEPDTGKQYCLTNRIPVRIFLTGMFGSSAGAILLVCECPDSKVFVLHEGLRNFRERQKGWKTTQFINKNDN